MAISPRNVKTFSASKESAPPFHSLSANASTRSPCEENALFCRCISSRKASVISTVPASVFILMHRPSSTSGAPFVKSSALPPISCRVDINFLSESKGSSPILGCVLRSSSSFPPLWRQNVSRAVSVGSPICVSPRSEPSLQSAPAVITSRRIPESAVPASPASHSRPSAKAFCTVMRFCVNVPVLSEQITETQPRLSTARRFLMIAFSFAIFCVPIASPIVTMELRASGIAATASATANISAPPMPMPRHTPSANTTAQTARMIMESFFEKSSRLR